MPQYLWENGDRNIFECCNLRTLEFKEGWQSFVVERETKTKSAFLGPLLWHYWSTPSRDCDDCSDDTFCEDCCDESNDKASPADSNQLWLCFAMEPGYTAPPYLYIVDVERSDEPAILTWLSENYSERGLYLKLN
jgi:hypothetical protein